MDWYESLPAELKEAPFLKAGDNGPKDLNQVVADLTDAAQHMGNSIRIPSRDAGDEAMVEFRRRAAEKIPGLMVMPSEDDPEAMNSVYRSMGMPEKPDDYRLPEIEGLELDDDAAAKLRQQAHALNMTQSQFAKMVESQHEQLSAMTMEQRQQLESGLAELKGEWGSTFDDRVAGVKTLLSKIEAPDYITEMLEAGTLPAADLKMFNAMADMIGAEGSEIGDQPNEPSGKLTPAQALAELDDIERRSDNALRDKMHPDHERLKKRRIELMMMAYPESDRGDLRTSFGS